MNGGPIAWMSRRQRVVAMSTSERGCQGGVVSALYLLEELGYTQEKATVLHEDNRACISMPTKDTMGKRSKHLDIATRFLQDLVQTNNIALQYCDTRENAADILTEPIPGTSLRICET